MKLALTVNPLLISSYSTGTVRKHCYSRLAAGRRWKVPLCSPRTPGQVADWAREHFEKEVDAGSGSDLNIPKLCMLIALEEEAAEAAYGLPPRSDSNNERFQRVFFPEPDRDHGSAATWSLKRLDSLAAEVAAAFQSNTALPASASSGSTSAQADAATAPRHPPHGQGQEQNKAQRPARTLLEDLAARESLEAQTAAEASASAAAAPPADHQHSSDADFGLQQHGQDSAAQTQSEVQDRGWGGTLQSAMRAFPAHSMSAVSHVLFDRHGYRRMPRHGDPRDAQLHRVLEQGTGCPAALAILYREVCARLGLHMEATVLDGGRYLVLWPRNFKGLQVAGQAVVIDAYSSGIPILAEELDPSPTPPSGVALEPLQPSSAQELLSSLLGALRDAHWCQAVGCAPEPAFMVPISLQTACRGLVGSLPLSYDLQRAIAAAERQALLLPNSGDVYLQLCILLYFAGEFKSALILLDASLDLLWDEDEQLLATFLAKLRLLRHHT